MMQNRGKLQIRIIIEKSSNQTGRTLKTE